VSGGNAAGVDRWRFGDDPRAVAAALAGGAVLAIPTESSYGLGVDPRDAVAVAAIYRLKERPAEKALPVVGADVAQLVALGVDPADPALTWAATRWPAALTVVARLLGPVPAAGGEGTLAVRVPAHAGLRELLRALGHPLTATSANPSGLSPFVDPAAVSAWLAAQSVAALVVDDGVLAGGPPSTLVAWRDGQPVVLRPGRAAIA
jgi:L-threonylcarbamoyladenylate synthase